MQSPASTNIRFGNQMNEELPENGQGDNAGSGQSVDKQTGVDKSGKVENFIRECRRNDKGLKHSGEECTTVEIYMNPVSQPLPDSPPSFSDARGSDNDGYYRCSEHVRIYCFFAFDKVFSCFQICMWLIVSSD